MKTESSDSILELIFEKRNKEYGAYELRTHYNDRLLKALSYALLSVGLIFLIPYLLFIIFSHPERIVALEKTTVYEIQPDIIFEKPQPPTAHSSAKTMTESFRVVKTIPPEEKKLDEKIVPVESNVSTTALPAGDGIVSGGNTNTTSLSAPTETIMNAAALDIAPSFPGGEKALMNFLYANIHFPRTAVENKIVGRVFVYFVINELGEITGIKIKQGVEESLDNEVIRVVNKMPKWSPGIYQGATVKSGLILPVSFTLK